LDPDRYSYLFVDPNGIRNSDSDPFGYADIDTDDHSDNYYHTVSNRSSQFDTELDIDSDIYSIKYGDFFSHSHG
jgi:hypothetical protein